MSYVFKNNQSHKLSISIQKRFPDAFWCVKGGLLNFKSDPKSDSDCFYAARLWWMIFSSFITIPYTVVHVHKEAMQAMQSWTDNVELNDFLRIYYFEMQRAYVYLEHFLYCGEIHIWTYVINTVRTS